MKKSIRILNIDDNIQERELVLAILLRKQNVYDIVTVDSREKIEEAIVAGGFDIVLTEIDILNFDGLQIISFIKEKIPDLPIIIITSKGSEEIAMNAMMIGISAYVIKSAKHLKNLSNLIENAIEHANNFKLQKQTLENYSISNKKYQLMFEKAPLGYQSLDLNGNFIEINQQWTDTLGYTAEEVIGKWFGDFLTPEYKDGFRKRFPLFKSQGHIHSEFEMVHKNGNILFIAFEGKIINDTKGKFKQTFCILQDITEQKKLEQALKQNNLKWEAMIAASPDGIGMVNLNGEVTYCSDKLLLLYGYKIDERASLIGKSMFDFIIPAHRKKLKDNFQKLIVSKTEQHIPEYLALRKDKSIFSVNVNANLILDANGKPTGVVFIERDVTERNEKAEKLKISEEKYRMFIDDASEAIFQGNLNGDLILVNNAAAELTAYSKDELLKMNLNDLFLEEDLVQNPLRYDLLEQGETIKTERRIKRKDGSVIFIEMNSKKLPDETYQAFIININERKEAEIALQQSEKKLKLITEKIHDVVWLMDLQGKSLFVSPSIKNFTGFSVEEYLAQTIEERFTPESATKGIEILKKEVFLYAHAELPKNYTKTVILDYLCKDGSVKTGELLITPFIENGKLVGFHGVTRDITERKKAEDKLRESNRKVNILVNNLRGAAYRCTNDRDWTMEYVSDGIFELTGYSSHDFVNNSVRSYNSIIVEEDQQLVWDTIQQCIKNKEPYTIEYRICTRDRKQKWVWERGRAVFEKENIVALEGFISDITERRQAENEKNKLLTIIENSSNEIYIFDTETFQFKYLNQGAIKNIGYSLSEIKKLTPIDIKPEYTKETFETLVNTLKTGKVKVISFETRHRRKNGTEYPVNVNLHLSKQANESVFLAVINDISELKKIEKEIIIKEQRYTDLVNNMSEGVYQSTPDGKFLSINPAMARIFGYESVEEMLSIDIKKELYFKPEDRGNTYPETGNDKHTELLLKKKDGSPIWVADSGWYIKNELGEVIRHEGILFDITEKKIVEEELKKSEENYRILFNSSPIGIVVSDLAGNIERINPTLIKLLGSPSEEETRKINLLTFNSLKEAGLSELLLNTIQTQKPIIAEREYKTKWGKTLNILTHYNPIFNQTGKIKSVQIIVQDITERKKVEKELIESEHKYRLLFENAIEGIFQTSMEGKYLNINPAFSKMFGFDTPQEMISSISNIDQQLYVRPNDRNYFKQQLIENGLIKNYEVEVYKKNGQSFWILINAHLVKKPNGEILYIEGTNIDINERKLAEIKLKENNARLELAMKTANMAWWEMDITTGMVVFEKRKAEMLGYTSDIFKHYSDFTKLLHPDDYEKAMNAMRSHFEGKVEKYEVEYRILTKSGEYKWFYDIGTIVERDINGKPLKVTGLVIDISERKLSEEKLLIALERLRRFIDANIVGVIIASPDGKISEANDYYLNLIGYTRKELESNNVDWRSITPKEWLHTDEKAIRELRETGKSTPYEKEYLRRDGSRVTVLIVDAMLPGDEEQIAGFVLDITEQKLAENKIKAIAKEWQDTFNSVSDAIWIMDTKGKIVRCNKASEKLLGLAEAAMQNRFCWEVMHHTNEPVKECPVLCLKSSHKREIFEMQEMNRYLEVTVDPMLDEKGELMGIVHVVSDITDRKKIESEIKKFNETLEHKVKIRTAQLQSAYNEMEAFTYSVSHDLRAPLRAIDGFAKMLLQDYSDIEPEAVRMLNVISQSSNNMGKLIEDLLAFSRVGRASISMLPLQMKELVQSVIAQIQRETNCKNTTINIGDLSNVEGDKTLLNQVWTNLIRNAIKFSLKKEHPMIEIGCYKEQNEIVYFVKDNGVGFDMNYVDKLFGVFQRLHSTDEFEGTGIGLAIVKKAIGRHGGRVWAESVEGEGATFYFTLPLSK